MNDKPGILIVEDNAIVAEDIKARIKKMGYQVTDCVARGELAIESVDKNSPDIILMDIKLKGRMTGIEAASAIHTGHDIPVIYLTSYADEETLSRAKLTGPFGYIVKPFDDKDLYSIIEITLYKHQMERKLKESELLLRTTLTSIGDGVITTDMAGCITFMNPVAESLTGWSCSEAFGKPLNVVFNIINEFSKKPMENPVAKVVETGQIIGLANHTLLITRDGRELPIKDSGSPIVLNGTQMLGVVLVFQDDSESRAAEKKLRDSEDRFKKLFEYAPLPYQSLDEQGNIIEVNQTWLDILGYQKNDVIGKSFADFLNPEWEDHFKENFPKFKALGEVLGVEFEMKKKDGTYIPTRFDGRIRRGQAGNFIQTHCVFRNLSEEKKLQKKIAEQEIALRQNQKLEAIGTLAGGIAHDFNNILSAVIGYTELSLDDIQKGTPLYENLTEVLNAGMRAKNLVKQILTFSRKGEEEKKPVQIDTLVRDALKMLRSTIPSNIEIKEYVGKVPVTITANTSQMNQVVMNLVTNAVHAIDGNGLIEIGVEKIHIDETRADNYPDIVPGAYSRLFVSDTGCGIARENLEAIFDPYFTTKTPDKGTGLGLAVVHGIVKIHGGHISVYSEPGKGTTFQVYLPLSEHSSRALPVQSLRKISMGTERILFVDDELSITRLQKQILERLGYSVTAQTSSEKALEIFRSEPDSFDLLITDMTMPGMTGDKLVLEIKATRPDLPVIICTGFSEKVNEKSAMDLAIDGFLMKPVDMKKMAETVRKVLDKAKMT